MKIITIHLRTLTWYDRTYGAAFFAGEITVYYNAKSSKTLYLRYEHGQDADAEQAACALLDKHLEIKVTPYLRQWCRDNDIICICTTASGKKADLKRFSDLAHKYNAVEN